MWGTLPDVLDRTITYHRDSVAIIEGERQLTYAELGALRNRIANALVGSGLGKGERVGLLLPNILEFIPIQHGIWAAGGVLVQMPTRQTANQFRSSLAQTRATTLIYDAQFDEAIAAIVPDLPELTRVVRVGGDALPASPELSKVIAFGPFVESADASARPDVGLVDDDEAYVLFTSGSTGDPKGVVNSHFTWGHYSITAGQEIGDIAFGEVFAHGAPLTHYTQIFILPVLLRGGTNVMLPGLDIDVLLSSIEKYGVTATAVVPTIIYLLIDHPRRADYDLSSLRTVVYAGSPAAPEKLRQALEIFGPIFLQLYAGTEQGYISSLRKTDHRLDSEKAVQRLASAGRPLPYVDVAIRDDEGNVLPVGEAGEITTRQLGQMLTYVDASRNAETLRDGWVHTGDVGRLDEDGFLYIVDRKKDMVISGGFNVFPRQVEDVLATHPAVAQSAVIGVPHEKWGEAVHAAVVVKNDAHVTEQELIDHVKAELGGVPAPKTIDFVDALPVNPAGKVDKKALREPFWAGRARQVS
ncbi:AMP-binding protein [Microbacterium sp. No. 7]|uniref:AMP-binding protein n=1 Tax=Microbacterium sp. No. 7 TaxID=1714373 RepID=UPI0006D208EA|nr:AMP-binding protein [Microbacterium sp. No. 7]ALJ21703.1 long-chain fatty acid--CoA ligase [Microbacterium sp. No. 7]